MEGRFRTFFLKLSDRCKRGKSAFAFFFLHLFYANHFQQDREYACESLLFAGFFNRRKFLPVFFSRRKISRDRFSSVFLYSRKKPTPSRVGFCIFHPVSFSRNSLMMRLSILDTCTWLTPIFSATSCWVYPLAFRRVAKKPPIVCFSIALKISFYDIRNALYGYYSTLSRQKKQ